MKPFFSIAREGAPMSVSNPIDVNIRFNYHRNESEVVSISTQRPTSPKIKEISSSMHERGRLSDVDQPGPLGSILLGSIWEAPSPTGHDPNVWPSVTLTILWKICDSRNTLNFCDEHHLSSHF